MAKSRKLPWFRIYTANRGALENIDNEKVGEALKAAMRYFESSGTDETIEESITDPLTLIAFGIFRQGADNSIEEYQARREDGRRGAEAKKQKLEQEAIEKYIRENGGDESRPNRVDEW